MPLPAGFSANSGARTLRPKPPTVPAKSVSAQGIVLPASGNSLAAIAGSVLLPASLIAEATTNDDPPDELGDTARSFASYFADEQGRSLQGVSRLASAQLHGPSPPPDLITAIRYAINTLAWPDNVISGVRAAMLIVRKGVPYVWGGTNPNRGLDCSGFAMYVLHVAGVRNLYRTTYEQATQGRKVSGTHRQPLDLCFFEPTSVGPGHVAIYMAQDWAVHEPHTGEDAQWLNLATWTPIETRRYLPNIGASDTPGVMPTVPRVAHVHTGGVYDAWKTLIRKLALELPAHHKQLQADSASLKEVFR